MPALREETKTWLAGYKGSFIASLDDKNRLTLPAAIRKTEAPAGSRSKKTKGRFVLTRWLNDSLALRPVNEWIRLESELASKSSADPKVQFFLRLLYESATEVVLDSQGRIPISKDHQKISEIKREVKVIGRGHYIELWSPTKFENYKKSFGLSFEEAVKDLNISL
jgi:MraZ protein